MPDMSEECMVPKNLSDDLDFLGLLVENHGNAYSVIERVPKKRMGLEHTR